MRNRSLAAFVLLIAGCTVSAAERTPDMLTISRAYMEHGVALGQAVPLTPLSCSDSTARRVADPDALQMITFATTNDDCTVCNLHLKSLGGVRWNDLPELEPFIVAWGTSRKRLAQLESGLSDTLGLTFPPVCIDQKGVLWDSLNVSHTPFSVILRNGRIIYLHDATLTEAVVGEQFYADVARLLGDGGGADSAP